MRNKYNRIDSKKIYDRLTILIPVFNEANSVIHTLEHIRKLEFDGSVKVYIVNDCSTDDSKEIITEYITQNMHFDISLFSNKKRIGKAQILNRFLPEIKDEIVLVLDANIRLSKDALSNLIRSFGKDTGILFGNLILQKNHYSSITEEEIWYWNLETFLKRLQNTIGNVTSPVGGFYLIRKSAFTYIPSDCLTEDMFLLINILSKGYSSGFCHKARGYEFTEKSTINEFRRKKRIMKGGFYILKRTIKDGYLNKISRNDLINLILNKFMRWIYPIFFFISIIFSSLLVRKNKLARSYILFNIIIFLMTVSEFIFNSFLNTILEKKRIRVRFFKKPLYFYTLMTSGIMALGNDKYGQRWEKDER